jgi:site-specific recombinase XerD
MKSDFIGSEEPNNLEEFNKLVSRAHPLASLAQELVIRGFSQRTIKSYLSHNQRFLDFIDKSAREINNQDIKDYLLFLKAKNYTNTSVNNVISALKFYYQQVLKRRLFFNVVRPKREKHLPQVLSKQQIKSIIAAAANLKHQLIISLLYGSGLRVSEVVVLKIEDLDLENKYIFVRGGKGNKDRYTLLSQNSIDLAREYLKILSAEQKYLFSGAESRGYLHTRTVQKIFAAACQKVKIKTNVTCHSLRHSFATHLLENGVSIRYIQKLLGHQSIKTTEIYLKVARDFWQNLNSPLDE